MSFDKKLLILPLLMLTACSNETPQDETPVARPVKSILVGSADINGVRRFPGLVDASQRADISFRVGGKLNKLLVKEGDDVKQGQVLAKLDATDFQIVVNDKQASFSRANADFNRAKQLIKKGHISRMDYDRLQADYTSRLADLNKAKRDLGYTILKAPFAGTIAQRAVDNFEEIKASQIIFALRNNELLEVKINVPENIMLRIKPGTHRKDADIPVWATFDNVPDKKFELKIKEVATKADRKTQTFLATFTMPALKQLSVLPGMTANVEADLSKYNNNQEAYYLPISAVTGDAKLQSRIWVVSEPEMTVHAQAVELGEMRGDEIAVLSGINGAERVVTAGAGYMAEGMQVTLMPELEQAEPRSEDIRFSLGQ